MKKKIIASAVLLGIIVAPFANGEVVRERRTPIPHQQPTYSPQQPGVHLSPQEIKEMQRRQEQQAALQRQEFEEQRRQKEQESLEARQKLHDKEGFYYGGKFAMGSGKVERRWESLWGDYTASSSCFLFGGIGMVGYRVSPWVRFELEGGGYSSSTRSETSWLRLLTCTGQSYVDIPVGNDSLWRPYVNAGIGIEDLGLSGGSSTYGCYNLGFGIGYAMTGHTILDISYRYRNALTSPTGYYTVHLRGSRELITGIRYMF